MHGNESQSHLTSPHGGLAGGGPRNKGAVERREGTEASVQTFGTLHLDPKKGPESPDGPVGGV